MADAPLEPSTTGQPFEQVLAAYLQAAEAGKAPRKDELLARHPDLAADLLLYFENHERFRHAARTFSLPPPRAAGQPGREGMAATFAETLQLPCNPSIPAGTALDLGCRLGDYELVQ